MGQETKTCPKCSSVMDFRLGEYTCGQCGHTEAKQIEQQQQQPKASGPGFRREQPWDKAQSSMHSPGAAPPPPSGTTYQPGATGAPYEQAYGASQEYSDPLQMEKTIYFWIVVVSNILVGILNMIGQSAAGGGASGFFAMAIGTLIGIGILYWVLFGETIWAKWCCLGCSAIELFFLLFVAFAGGAMIAQMFSGGDGMYYQPGEYGMASFLYWLFILMSFAWAGWFISILWRDINYRQGR